MLYTAGAPTLRSWAGERRGGGGGGAREGGGVSWEPAALHGRTGKQAPAGQRLPVTCHFPLPAPRTHPIRYPAQVKVRCVAARGLQYGGADWLLVQDRTSNQVEQRAPPHRTRDTRGTQGARGTQRHGVRQMRRLPSARLLITVFPRPLNV